MSANKFQMNSTYKKIGLVAPVKKSTYLTMEEKNYIKIDCSKMNSRATVQMAKNILDVIQEQLESETCSYEVRALND